MMAAVDLTPKPSTPWWSLFRCCHPPPSPGASAGDAEQGECARDVSDVAKLVLNVATDGKVVREGVEEHPDTPATAFSELSAEASFESDCNDFIGEVAVTTPKSKNNPSPYAKSVSFSDDEDDFDFIGELEIATPRTAFAETLVPLNDSVEEENSDGNEGEDDGDDLDDVLSKMSDPDNYWYAELDFSQSPMRASPPPNNELVGQAEIGFYYFMVAVMLRYVFGTWLPATWDMTNIFRQQLLLTTGDSGERKEIRKTMTLRNLKVKDDRCEVVPQLKREKVGSFCDMTAIDE